jgi:hypothetical protein
MKTAINIVIIAIMFTLLSSCEDNHYDEVYPKGLITEISGEIFIDEYDPELLNGEKCENIQNCLSGTGNSIAPRLEEISLECSYDLTVMDVKYDNQIHLKNGGFTISDDRINTIYGFFHGCGGYCDDIFNVELLFEITGGEGYYRDATGIIRGKIISVKEYPKILYLKIKGEINHFPDKS